MNTVVPRFIFCLFFLIGLSVALVSECSDSGTLTESDFTFTYSRDGDYVYITASVETDTWVAIGFSEDELMPDTDVAVGAKDGSDYFLDDRYNTYRSIPPFDSVQNLYNREVEVENGTTTISFKRLVVTNDEESDISLDECRYVLWAYGGDVTSYGTDGQEGVFRGHSDRGVFSDKICLCDSAGMLVVSTASMITMMLFALFFNMDI